MSRRHEVDRSLSTASSNLRPVAVPPVLEALRNATAVSHQQLDAAFGSVDMGEPDGFVRFLKGHAIGMAAVFAPFRSFVERELCLSCPDYPAALSADLATFGADSARLPRISPPRLVDEGAALGLAYVVAGSRLGLAMLRKRGYASQTPGCKSLYMEDESGLVIWRLMLRYMRETALDKSRIDAACVAALDTFACFANAFDASRSCDDHFCDAPESDAA